MSFGNRVQNFLISKFKISTTFEYNRNVTRSILAMIFLESPLPLADQRGTVRPIQGCRTLKRFLSAKMMKIKLTDPYEIRIHQRCEKQLFGYDIP